MQTNGKSDKINVTPEQMKQVEAVSKEGQIKLLDLLQILSGRSKAAIAEELLGPDPRSLRSLVCR